MAYFRQFSDITFAIEVAEYAQAREALIEIARKLDEGVDLQNLDWELPEEGICIVSTASSSKPPGSPLSTDGCLSYADVV